MTVSRLKDIPGIGVDKMGQAADDAGNSDMLRLENLDTDLRPPEEALEATLAAIGRDDANSYLPFLGTNDIRRAATSRISATTGQPYDWTTQCVISAGGLSGILNALLAILEPGDEVIIPAPYWVSYPDMTLMAEGTPVVVECQEENDFKITAAELEAAITPKTKWVVLNSPSNPTGAAYSRAELRAIADVLLKHENVYVMSDDMYEHLVYDGFEFTTIAQIEPKLKERTLTCNGVSKSYAMTGWRLGYAAGPKDLIKAINKVQSQSSTHTSSISQAASVEALNGPQDFLKERAEVFKKRRDLVVAALNECEGLSCKTPEGAFYVYPSCAGAIGKTTPDGKKIETDTDFVTYLLEAEGVAAVQGSAFGLAPYFRISYATSDAALTEACARIKRACAALK